MSRKLIFVAGFFMCFSCRSAPTDRLRDAKSEHELISALIDQLLVYVGLTPLEIVADAMLEYRIDPDMRKSYSAPMMSSSQCYPNLLSARS